MELFGGLAYLRPTRPNSLHKFALQRLMTNNDDRRWTLLRTQIVREEDKIADLKERLAVMFPKPVDQFYEAPAKITARKRGKELISPLKRQVTILPKQSSKAFKVRRKSKGARLSDFLFFGCPF